MINTSRVALRQRITVQLGGVVALALLGLSAGLFWHQRAERIDNVIESGTAVTRAFSIPVLNGLIHAENDLPLYEGFLDNLVFHFLRQNQRVLEVVVFGVGHVDRVSRVEHISQSVVTRAGRFNGAEIIANAPHRAGARIFFHRDHGKVLVSRLPLCIAGKCWGQLAIAFEASSIQAEVRQLAILLIAGTIFVIVVMLGLLHFLAGRLTKSLGWLMTQMERVRLGEPARRVWGRGTLPYLTPPGDEFEFLKHRFETMRQRLTEAATDLVAAEQQIQRAEKLASVGRLASGVAHEINNPLNGMKSCLYAIRSDPDDREQNAAYIEMIEEGLDHIATIVGKLLGYARRQEPAQEPFELSDAIDRVLPLIAYRFNTNEIEVDVDLAPDLPAAVGDARLIEEVIMNLLLNALDAIGDRGTVRICVERTESGRIRCAVWDSGCGIPASNLETIFDPFFTTKAPDHGTGLGLSVSQSIVEAHGGGLTVHSEAGRFTEFCFTLPIAEAT